MRKLLAFFSALVFAVVLGFASRSLAGVVQQPAKQEAQPQKSAETQLLLAGLKIPPEEAERKNPVKPTQDSIAAGKRFYATQCAMCHGVGGDGKGVLVEPMKLSVRDWRDPASLKDFSDGSLFYILAKGTEKMPGQEGRMKPDEQWNMINYIRSLAKKEAPKPEAKKP